MIKELSVHPKPKNNNAKIAFLVAVLISAVGFTFYFFMGRYRGVVGTFALFSLVTAILFYTKFISPAFYYDITFDSEGAPLFVVRQIIGKRQTTLCRVDLADVISVVRETRDERRAHKTPREMRKYVYAPTMMPSEIYRMTVKSRYEKAEIIIEISEEFAEVIRESAAEARALSGEE